MRVDVVMGGADAYSTLSVRVGAWFLHELRAALPPTMFFFVGFNYIILTTNLLVADYAVAVSNFMLATVAALVVGKAVITANAMPFLKLFDRAPLIQPILFKTAIYWFATFIARLAGPFVFMRQWAVRWLLRTPTSGGWLRHLPRSGAVRRFCDSVDRAGRESAIECPGIGVAIEPAAACSRANALEQARGRT